MRTRFFLPCLLLAAAFLPVAAATAQQIIRRSETTTTTTRRTDRDQKPEPPPADPGPPATLHWNNGESVTGELTGATDDCLVWKTPLFEDPLELSWSVLHRVDKNAPDSEPADAFAFLLRDGSRLYGDLTGVTAGTVSIHSTRHGDAVLRRAEVIGAWRLKGQRLLYAGPWGESGWKPAQNVRVNQENTNPSETLGKVPTRLTGPGGSLVLPFWHRTVSNALTLPDRSEVEFHLHAKDLPAFQLVLDGREKKRLRIETWGNEIVLATSKGFEKVCELNDKDRSVALRVCWDRPARRCAVYTAGGTLLKEWDVPEGSEGSKPAILVANKGRNLSLDFLRVREWDGGPLPPLDAEHPRVELDDGSALAGTVSGLADGTLMVAPLQGEGTAGNVALADVDAVVFSTPAPWNNSSETMLCCADGTILRGRINGFQEGRALLKTSFSDAPLPVKLDDLRQLFVQAAEPLKTTFADAPLWVRLRDLRRLMTRAAVPSLDSLDKIVVQGTTLHGHLVATTNGSEPRWLPVGGKVAVTPSHAAVSEITRVFPPGAVEPSATSLLYTRMGDALPGVLRALDRKEFEFDSPWIEAKTLPAEEMQAVQFDATDKGAVSSFEAPGWQVLKGDKAEVRGKDGTVKLVPNTIFGHPSASQDGEVKFTYDTENYAYLRVRLFCEGTNTAARSLNYILMRANNRVSSGVESSEGQFSNQHQTPTPAGAVAIRFGIDEKAVRVYVNDTLAETVWYPASKRPGAGLILESSSVWGNPAQEIVLSKFSASSPTSRSFLVSVNAEAKSQALTIPRFRKDDPPRHALLAANGDVLRGEIVALTNTQIGFRIGLETLHIPRERVAAVIALQPPAITPEAPDDTGTMQKLLERHVSLQTGYNNVGYNSLLSIIRQSVPELKFQTPNDQDARRAQFLFNNQSVGDVLDSICEQFDLRYHIERNIIVFETRAGKPESNLVHRTFWMKTNPFAGQESAAEQLAAKDVPFPKGSSAEWQESSRCLEVVNTAANVEKVSRLLDNEFGGTLGSPTHWLLLRNGGRIGLAVEKFEPDAVTGTHPIYGRCKVPLAEVYAVRNTLPEPTAAARAVNGWKMVYAPEPVLPESGGESSEMLGKAAPTFKLKTLDGKDFDLGGQQGSVVVLDFWATWCGPCIKSLPGLIEAVGRFPADKVKLIGVNQAEAPEQVRRFLEAHRWNLTVAMDAGQAVAKQYGVDGIPHTVIVAPDGKVAWVQTGASADGDEKAAGEITKLLGGNGESPR